MIVLKCVKLRAPIFCLLGLFVIADARALEIQFDYRFDTNRFFADPVRRYDLTEAAKLFESRIQDHFEAITPSGGNMWTLHFPSPSSGEDVSIANPTVPADRIVIYVGARNIGEHLGVSNYAVYSPVGDSDWVALLNRRRNSTNFDSVGGAIAFNSTTNWYFDGNLATVGKFDGYDFYSVAVHEIGHLLGFLRPPFQSHITNVTFVGPRSNALFGGPIPMEDDVVHIRQGTSYKNNVLVMVPRISEGTRRFFTEVEFAMLADIGYSIAQTPEVKIASITRTNDTLSLKWGGGVGPFKVQSSGNLLDWSNSTETLRNRTFQLPATGAHESYRILDLGQ